MIEMERISIDVPKAIIHILKVRKRELPRVLREIMIDILSSMNETLMGVRGYE